MAKPHFHRILRQPFDPAELRQAREDQVRAAKAAGLSELLAWDLAAVADELVSNILEHSQATWLEWSLSIEGFERARLVLRDNGPAFDAARSSESAEEMAGDGTQRHMGLLMVKRVVESMEYNRLPDGSNELTLCAGPPAQRRVMA